jgi:hypothetical protein
MPDVGESIGKRLNATMGYVIEPLLNAGNRLLAFIPKPLKSLDQDLFTATIPARGEFFLDKGFEIVWDINLHSHSLRWIPLFKDTMASISRSK